MTYISCILPLSKDISKHKKPTTGERFPKFGKQWWIKAAENP